MKIVVVSASAPPSNGSHATRVAAFVSALVAEGYDVTLVTCAWPEALKNQSTLYARLLTLCSIQEASGGPLRQIARAASKTGWSPRVGRVLQTFRAFGRRAAVPDSFVTWIPQASRLAARAAQTDSRSLILSTGAPFSAHVAAAIAARLTRRPLILDYGDPWVHEPGRPRKGLRLLIESGLERFALSHARRITVTTDETARLYEATYLGAVPPITVLPMGYDPKDIATDRATHLNRRGPLRIAYAGRVNEEYRSLTTFKSVLKHAAELNRQGREIRFEFYGSEQARLEQQLAPFVRDGLVAIRGTVDHAEFLSVLRNADGLLVFGNNNYIQVPGKIAQYITAKRPILYLPNVPDLERDPGLNILKNCFASGLFVFTDPSDFSAFVHFAESRDQADLQMERANEFSWGAICARLLGVIGPLMKEGAP